MVGFYGWLSDQLSLFVRQQAWLCTAPDRGKGEKFDPPSRIDAMRKRGDHVPIPPNPAPYLTGWLFEIGPTVPGGMSPAPLGWLDMAAWQGISGVELLPWEASLIRQLSRVFVSASHDARKRDCPAPWTGIETADDVERQRSTVDAKLKSIFGGLKPAE